MDFLRFRLHRVEFGGRRTTSHERTTELRARLLSPIDSRRGWGSANPMDRHLGGQPGANDPRFTETAAQCRRPDGARARARLDRRRPDLPSPFERIRLRAPPRWLRHDWGANRPKERQARLDSDGYFRGAQF